ncbi:MAG TPA: glutamate synthase subunit beta [Spirochaetota bacterium]|nr:glutamate synthase subunit beta [Spirochaetota bacterium]HPC39850.1 glutamate synthase subunit beta [Spirochaetota bacterium]HPL16472.1 glutamate synthase subunit beta [Spirochaetota bacterium]HQF08974.1 glutamate synthase subunit beta [Spirochaetota bacterium]HQH98782.1 glutamate synthase subunit beta [Spirochaetota bacterium]
MGDPKGFMNIRRQEAGYRPVEERVNDYSEVEKHLPDDARRLQASRCMDCGVPFCHWACPVSNIMPEWQDRVFRGDWKGAYDILQETNNFPEFTGRVCPALCEASCVLAIGDEAVTIRQNELAVIEKAYSLGLVKASPPKSRTGKKVGVIGGGPAGLACADLLNRAGHNVTIFESADGVGGYLRYGIPDFKLNKYIIDRRVNIMVEEGIAIKTGVTVGMDVPVSSIRKDFDALCIAIGSREARDLPIPGRELAGIHQALDYLVQQNRVVKGDTIPDDEIIRAYDKNVVVIGGGDTGSDCVGTANRQGARSITQLELLPKPPEHRTDREPWPLWPKVLKVSSSHEEGCARMWNVSTRRFIGDRGRVTQIVACAVEWTTGPDGKPVMTEVPGSEFTLNAELVLLAMGFIHPVHSGLVNELGLELDGRGNIKIDENAMTSVDGVFSAGDSSRGASLVVHAIQDGRMAAAAIDRYLSRS